jgi:hypothetical protein
MVIGKSTIVVQRQGPVLFKVGSDDGFKLYLNGEQVISHWEPRPYGETSRFINLNPRIYELELHYYELTERAVLSFQTDQDVLQWVATGQCFGTYTSPPVSRYFLHESLGKSLAQVADQFGVASEEISVLNPSLGKSVLMPGTQSDTSKTKVIVIGGIGSSGSCSETSAAPGLRKTIVRAIQTEGPSANGLVSQIDDKDVIAYSYSGDYSDCVWNLHFSAQTIMETRQNPTIPSNMPYFLS